MKRIIFYVYDKMIELNGKQFPLGEVTADILNLSPDDYQPMAELFSAVESLEQRYEKDRRIEDWLPINEKLRELTRMFRAYKILERLFDGAMDTYFDEEEEYFQNGEHEYEGIDLLELRWFDYREIIDVYRMCLHDIRAFNQTVRNFVRFFLSKLRHNSPEEYAGAYYDFLNNPSADKLIVNPWRDGNNAYLLSDPCAISYEPVLRDGKAVIATTYQAENLQMILKTDFFGALNVGHKIHRCATCGKYFMVRGGAHVLYCENACPQMPQYTCRQYGAYNAQKEKAKDNPKLAAKTSALGTIRKHRSRGLISDDEAERAKAYINETYYQASTQAGISLEEFVESVSAQSVYAALGIQRKTKSRGRPPKKEEDAPSE